MKAFWSCICQDWKCVASDLHAGESKTDARDAYIIGEATRGTPRALHSLKLADDQVAEISML
jgi:hypothetical protein